VANKNKIIREAKSTHIEMYIVCKLFTIAALDLIKYRFRPMINFVEYFKVSWEKLGDLNEGGLFERGFFERNGGKCL
jgi:hypothetical protein